MTERDKLVEQTMRRLLSKEIHTNVAVETLSLTDRQIRRIKARYKAAGIKGIIHKARGKPSNRALPEEKRRQVLSIIQQNYPDFGPTLATEKLSENHNITISVEVVRKLMAKAKLWTPHPRKPNEHPHTWRERRSSYGEMEQYDGSYHDWFEGRLVTDGRISKPALLCAIDDATGTITYAKFDTSEGVVQTFSFWKEYTTRNGKPMNIYLDRFSTYKNNIKKTTQNVLELTQFERACNQLNINPIHAKSPEAKGRIERLFGTLQDRLVKELRLQKISTIAEANQFLLEVFIPNFNQKFGVKARNPNDVHTKLEPEELTKLESIFSIQDHRIITNDYLIMYETRFFQLDPKQKTLLRTHDKVMVEKRLSGTIVIAKNGTPLVYTEVVGRPRREKPVKVAKPRGAIPKQDHPYRKLGRLAIAKREAKKKQKLTVTENS